MIAGAMLALGGCATGPRASESGSSEGVSAFPTNYKPDILAAMRVYLNDPTGIRDGAISPPVQKAVGNSTRYVACVRFNPKANGKTYAGAKEIMAVFIAGHFDHFAETPRDACAGAAYAPFPELSKLTR